ncbi:MAG: hypothetical protein SGJ18_13035 [Pseudomonadota bacterium]|nr:hypothetical protein [Pseudomonadota bacterium]
MSTKITVPKNRKSAPYRAGKSGPEVALERSLEASRASCVAFLQSCAPLSAVIWRLDLFLSYLKGV